MVKVPRPGRVKTRLGCDIGTVPAAWWFRHQIARLLRRLEDPRWNVVLAVTPDIDGMTTRVWPARIERWPQGRGQLGERMLRMIRRAKGPVCVIGADIPDITRAHVAEAFAALGGNDIVFGPATDGGYWLIGAKSGTVLHPDALERVRWSSQYTLSDSQAALNNYRIAFVRMLSDVDRAKDLP